ncbi:MAG: NAD-dependent protein deacylase [Pseudomonadota bacterium]
MMDEIDNDPELVAQLLAALIKRSQRLVVMTGAGMSADSGLPTYRGVGGLYNDIVVDEHMEIEEILHIDTFAKSPALTWKYLAEIERACRGASANEGHRILAKWQALTSVCVITQNVDGFHRDAGSEDLIELHGNLRELYCCDCGSRLTVMSFEYDELPPRCGHCDGVVRPDVVLFGEMLPGKAVAAYEKAFDTRPDLVLSIGTSAGFPYIHGPVLDAAAQGVTTVEINPGRTILSSTVAHRMTTGAMSALKAIDRLL